MRRRLVGNDAFWRTERMLRIWVVCVFLGTPLTGGHRFQRKPAPRIWLEPVTVESSDDEQAKLLCNITGKIEWFLANGTKLRPPQYDNTSDGSLLLADPDDGTTEGYYCTANVEHVGSVRSRTVMVHFSGIFNLSVSVGNDVYLPNCKTGDNRPPGNAIVFPDGSLLWRNVSYSLRPVEFPCGVVDTISSSKAMPVFSTEPTDLVMKVNSTKVLPCIGSGHPAPSATWYHHGNKIDDWQEDRGTVQYGGVLIFFNAPIDASGNYTCIINNSYGEQKRTVIVIVTDIPQVNSSFSDVVTVTGNTAVFSFQIPSFVYSSAISYQHQLNITWLINNTAIHKNTKRQNISIRKNRDGTNSLSIPNISLSDEGMYQALVTTPLGNIQTTFRLRVSDYPGKPRNLTLTQKGEQLILKWNESSPGCDFSPLCQSNFYFVESLAADDAKQVSETHYTLNLNEKEAWRFLDWKNPVTFYVTAFNQGLRVSSPVASIQSTVDVNVIVTIKKAMVSSMILSYDCPFFWTDSDQLHEITLSYKGEKDANWTKQDIPDDNKQMILTVDHLQPFTLYTFKIDLVMLSDHRKAFGSISCLTSMTTPKQAPDIISVYRLTATSGIITWKSQVSNTASQIDIEVDYGGKTHLLPQIGGNSQQGIVTDLDPWVDYSFPLKACCSSSICADWNVNSIGCGHIPHYRDYLCNQSYCGCTNFSLPKTMEPHPLNKAALNFRTFNISSNSVMLSWSLVSSPVVFIAYRVNVSSITTGKRNGNTITKRLKSSVNVTEHTEGKTAYQVLSLCPETKYEIALELITSDRQTPSELLSRTVDTKAASAPPPVSLSVSWFNKGFHLRWLANGSCPVEYDISYCPKLGSCVHDKVWDKDGGNMSVTVDDELDAGATYLITVKPEGGERSEPVEFLNGFDPSFVNFSSSMTSSEEDEVKVNCTAIGYPVPTIKLLRDDGDAEPAGDCCAHKFSLECKFSFNRPESRESVFYTCFAENELGKVNETLKLAWNEQKTGVPVYAVVLLIVLTVSAFIGIVCGVIHCIRKRHRKSYNRMKKKSAVGPHRKESENTYEAERADADTGSGLEEPHRKYSATDDPDLEKVDSVENQASIKPDILPPTIPWRPVDVDVAGGDNPRSSWRQKVKRWLQKNRDNGCVAEEYVMTEIPRVRRPSRLSTDVSKPVAMVSRRRTGVSCEKSPFIAATESRETTPATVTDESREVSPAETVDSVVSPYDGESVDDEAVQRELTEYPGPEPNMERRQSAADYVPMPMTRVAPRVSLTYVDLAELQLRTGSSGYGSRDSSGEDYVQLSGNERRTEVVTKIPEENEENEGNEDTASFSNVSIG